MNDFTIAELDLIHASLITREHRLRKVWIENNKNVEEVNKYTEEVKRLRGLSAKVCAAKLSRELGFYVEPVPV
jgi:hypothetical protein